MASLARCIHCPLPRSSASGISLRIYSSPVDSSGSSRPFALKKENLNVHVPHQERRIIRRCEIMHFGEVIPQMPKSERIDLKQSRIYSLFWENAHGDQDGMMFRLPKALLLTSIWMLTLPIEVLAETCETDKAFLKMPLLFAIAVIGATVGGLLARTRKDELKRLNDQLRQINEALRRQAKIESYAPGLSYAPVGRLKETEVIVDPKKQQLLTSLRTGKKFLRNQDPRKAFAHFKEAFDLAQRLEDHIEEKKAARGLGASLQRQGKYREAIKYHSKVLEISKQTGEVSGITEAYGAIADCYTELGDLERAAKFYDKYIARLETD
ncbi:protein FLUORESCENT IN BLUE LIGHT, chloroplastic isoform X1 [Canna indica]|uniref:Protein FLUORESCENT IN BLUE LIGHT, chloroplastic isoform X1 n=1 Tax=Canna indica TaxID=4628 RepID=A0AAQ3KUP2_9LILI|nr:protein FLUORESCENT IN BLUE LIGHT, chloroplastic isoform X1 [Canna indica]